MTRRNGARLVDPTLFEDEFPDDSDGVSNPDMRAVVRGRPSHNKNPRTQPQLVTTDFGVTSLAKFLKEEHERQEYEQANIGNASEPTATEAEYEKLQKLVNSGKVVKASIRKDRLCVRELDYQYSTALLNSTNSSDEESSEDETLESERLYGDTIVAGSTSKARCSRKRRSKSARSTVVNPVALREIAHALSYEVSDGKSLDLDTMYRLFIGGPYESSISAALKYEQLLIKAGAILKSRRDEDADSSFEIISAAMVALHDVNDLKNKATGTKRVSSPPPQVSLATRPGLETSNDAFGGQIPATSASLNDRRLSFVKHANEARHSTRSNKGKGKAVSKKLYQTESADSSSAASDSPLPRKKLGDKAILPSEFTVAAIASALEHGDPTNDIDFDSVRAGYAVHGKEDVLEALGSSPGASSGEDTKMLNEIKAPNSAISNIGAFDIDMDDDIKTDHTPGQLDNKSQGEIDAIAENAKKAVVTVFDYDSIVPERIPHNILVARENCKRIFTAIGLDSSGKPKMKRSKLSYSSRFNMPELDPDGTNILKTANKHGHYPRGWKATRLPISPHAPPVCPAGISLDQIPPSILPLVCSYLSSQEIRRLRLVNRATAAAIMPLMIRSTVIEFGRKLFDSTDNEKWDSKSDHPAASSIMETYSGDINRFGISFEFNPLGLANARRKTIEEDIEAWFGTYCWPTKIYPRFRELKDLEDLVDGNRALLKNTMKTLTQVTELALSVDSGHGWLSGPDISDMAMLRKDIANGNKVFGKTFDAADPRHEFALREYFLWSQLNTLNAFAKAVAAIKEPDLRAMNQSYIERIRIRQYDDYRVQIAQPDYESTSHIGGHQVLANTAADPGAVPAPLVGAPVHWHAHQNHVFAAPAQWNHPPNNFLTAFGLGAVPGGAGGGSAAPLAIATPSVPLAGTTALLNAMYPNNAGPSVTSQFRHHPRVPSTKARDRAVESGVPINPQWPLIFNCMNLAAAVGGNQFFVQDEVSHPSTYPYMPGNLTETQVQWLMETLWAQRAFMIAYTNGIITNAAVYKNVQTLIFAKLSSGLIQYLSQEEFWTALPSLKKLTLKVIPDWRQEHLPGDKQFYRNMPISPVEASIKLADLLKNTIAKIEHLSTLTVGFVGGGEHQTGMFARNRHVLPAPIVRNADAWIHRQYPDQRTMLVFNHIRNLTFENCWFSPKMLEIFMHKSRDTSLHHLTLDSVSMTGVNEIRTEAQIMAEYDQIQCKYPAEEWLQEKVTRNACWVKTLDVITPGRTTTDLKYDAGLIDEELFPRPERLFKGNVKSITLKSCGYVRLSGTRDSTFSQDGVLEPRDPKWAVDEGLTMRKRAFRLDTHEQPPAESLWFAQQNGTEVAPSTAPNFCIMMNATDPSSGKEYFGLGRLTSCVLPIEKRILERAWGMTFGWGDDMGRWAAVEDGCYEGGTGRFSGRIEREEGENEY